MANGRQIKKKVSAKKQAGQVGRLIEGFDALVKHMETIDDRLEQIEDVLQGFDERLKKLEDDARLAHIKRKEKTRLEVPLTAIGLKNAVQDFNEAVVHDQAEVVTYLPEDEPCEKK